MGCSAANRACPKCGNDKVTEWIGKQEALLLPIPHFFLTFTLPASARAPARSNQKVVYGILMKTAWEALRKLAGDPRFLGADIGAVAILQTWKRDMSCRPVFNAFVTTASCTPIAVNGSTPFAPCSLSRRT